MIEHVKTPQTFEEVVGMLTAIRYAATWHVDHKDNLDTQMVSGLLIAVGRGLVAPTSIEVYNGENNRTGEAIPFKVETNPT